MSGANPLAGPYLRHVMGFLDQIEGASKRAEVTDENGEWGVDGWIRVIHDLIDAQLRTCASLTLATIEGPWWWKQKPYEPSDLDGAKAVAKTTYDRRFEIVEQFERVGCPGDFINKDQVGFLPEILPAGEVEYLVTAPEQYWGHNYKGKVKLIQVCGPGTTPETCEQTITIGL